MSVNKFKISATLLSIITASLLSLQACSTATTDKVQQDQTKVVLEFLEARENGLFEECSNLLSDEYLDRFKNKYHTDFADYFRNQNEEHFKESTITAKSTSEDGMSIITVSTIVEGPGYNSRAIERFWLSQKKGVWIITDREIKYQE